MKTVLSISLFILGLLSIVCSLNGIYILFNFIETEKIINIIIIFSFICLSISFITLGIIVLKSKLYANIVQAKNDANHEFFNSEYTTSEGTSENNHITTNKF